MDYSSIYLSTSFGGYQCLRAGDIECFLYNRKCALRFTYWALKLVSVKLDDNSRYINAKETK